MFKLNKNNILFGLLILTAIALATYLVFLIIGFQDKSIPAFLETETSLDIEEPEELEFIIERSGIIQHDFAIKKIYEVVITGTSRENVETVANQIIKEVTDEDNDIDEIHLMFFSDKELINAQAYDVAQAIWGPSMETGMTEEIAEQNLRDDYEIRIIMREDELGGFGGTKVEEFIGPKGQTSISPE